MSPRSRNCLLTHSPMSVAPASSRACGCARAQGGQLVQRARREEAVAAARHVRARRRQRERAARQRTQGGGGGFDRQAIDRRIEHALRRHRGSAGSRCSGTGCRRARRPAAGVWASFAGRQVALVAGGQRHHEARRAEAALRAVAVDHGLLHRMHVPPPRRLTSSTVNSALPCSVGRKRMQALTGCSASPPPRVGLADDHRAGAAVALGAAFLGAGAARVFAQPLQHRARGRGVPSPRPCGHGGRTRSLACSWLANDPRVATGVPRDEGHYSPADMSGDVPPSRRALRADLLDFTGDPGLGAPTAPRCAFAPTTGC